MKDSNAGAPADPEFLEFVRARQHVLLRGAFLVVDDLDLAERTLTRALSALARQWAGTRDERPDTVVRGSLYRDLLAALSRRRRPDPLPVGRAGTASPDPAAEGPAAEYQDPGRENAEEWHAQEQRRRLQVRAALAELPPQQRAVLVLRVLDERSTQDTAQILGLRGGVVDAELDAARGLAAIPLSRGALELASEDVDEVDLAERAWELATRQRRTVRRRALLGVAGVALAGTTTAVVRRGGAQSALRVSPSPTGTSSMGPDGTLPFLRVDGIRVSLAPEPRLEPDLPRYPDAGALALPEVLGPSQGRGAIHPVLGPAAIEGVAESVRAVFLVHALDGGYEPVVYVPSSGATHLVVPSVRLGRSGAAAGDGVPVLGPRTISGDRHHLVFAQPGALIVLDTRDASTTWIDVPDPTLSTAGWARDGVTVIARGSTESWVVDTRTRSAAPAEGPVGAEWVDLVDLGSRSLLRSFSGTGQLTGTREMRGPGMSPTSPPVANTEGWVAVGAAIPESLSRAVARDQGVVVVQGDLRPSARILAASQAAGDGAVPYRAVAWGPGDVALLESLSIDQEDGSPRRRLLAWDVIGGHLWLASDLEPEGAGVGGFTGSWAI